MAGKIDTSAWGEPVTVDTADWGEPEGRSEVEPLRPAQAAGLKRDLLAELPTDEAILGSVREFGRGLAPFYDEMAGGINSLLPGSGSYREEVDKIRNASTRYRKDNPKRSAAAHLYGMSLGPGKFAKLGKGFLQKALVGMGLSAASGADESTASVTSPQFAKDVGLSTVMGTPLTMLGMKAPITTAVGSGALNEYLADDPASLAEGRLGTALALGSGAVSRPMAMRQWVANRFARKKAEAIDEALVKPKETLSKAEESLSSRQESAAARAQRELTQFADEKGQIPEVYRKLETTSESQNAKQLGDIEKLERALAKKSTKIADTQASSAKKAEDDLFQKTSKLAEAQSGAARKAEASLEKKSASAMQDQEAAAVKQEAEANKAYQQALAAREAELKAAMGQTRSASEFAKIQAQLDKLRAARARIPDQVSGKFAAESGNMINRVANLKLLGLDVPDEAVRVVEPVLQTYQKQSKTHFRDPQELAYRYGDQVAEDLDIEEAALMRALSGGYEAPKKPAVSATTKRVLAEQHGLDPGPEGDLVSSVPEGPLPLKSRPAPAVSLDDPEISALRQQAKTPVAVPLDDPEISALRQQARTAPAVPLDDPEIAALRQGKSGLAPATELTPQVRALQEQKRTIEARRPPSLEPTPDEARRIAAAKKRVEDLQGLIADLQGENTQGKGALKTAFEADVASRDFGGLKRRLTGGLDEGSYKNPTTRAAYYDRLENIFRLSPTLAKYLPLLQGTEESVGAVMPLLVLAESDPELDAALKKARSNGP